MSRAHFRSLGRVPALLGIAFAAVAGWSCRGDADFSDAMPPPVTLSAEAYQSEIMEIDRLIFDEKPVTPERRQRLAARIESLSRRVARGSDSKFLGLEELELRRLALVAKRLPSASPPPALANDWMRIRNNLFDDRAWMARSARDPDPR